MKERNSEDFSGVISDLIFNDENIVAVPVKFTNSDGVYHNPNAKEGFQYAVAFATVDDRGCTWVETFGVEKDGTKFTVRGRWGSKYMDKRPPVDEVMLQASEMVDQHLRPCDT